MSQTTAITPTSSKFNRCNDSFFAMVYEKITSDAQYLQRIGRLGRLSSNYHIQLKSLSSHFHEISHYFFINAESFSDSLEGLTKFLFSEVATAPLDKETNSPNEVILDFVNSFQPSVEICNKPPINKKAVVSVPSMVLRSINRVYTRMLTTVIRLYFRLIKYLKSIIRNLLGFKLLNGIIQALHRIFYMPHSFVHGSTNADDDDSNTFLSITAQLLSSRKGDILLTSSGLG